MGGSETKIEYKEIDRTDPKAAEKGRKAAKEENDLRVKELMEKLRQEQARDMASALGKAKAQNLQESNAYQAEKKRREEEERKMKLQEEETRELLNFEKMKGELINYEFGDKLTTKALESEGIDYSDMDRLVIAMFGPAGSGKTSFIGTMERTLLGEEKQTAFAQGEGREGTIILQEYLPKLKINLLDTRGFFEIDDNTLTEVLSVMTGRTRGGEVVTRKEDAEEQSKPNLPNIRSKAKFSDRVHAVVFVVQAHDIRLKKGTYLQRMQKIRDHFRYEGHSPITVITFEGKIENAEDRDLAFQEASAATGSPIDRTFFIENYTTADAPHCFETEKKAVNILDTALLSAERFVKIQKLRERHHGNAEASAITEFFKQNQALYKWNPQRVSTIVEALDEMGISTVESLKESWDDVKGEVKMTIGIRTGLEEALNKV